MILKHQKIKFIKIFCCKNKENLNIDIFLFYIKINKQNLKLTLYNFFFKAFALLNNSVINYSFLF